MPGLHYDLAHLLSALVLLLSFSLLHRRRLLSLLNAFALQSAALAAAAAWQGYVQDQPHLYVTAALALAMKAIAIPLAIRRISVRLAIPPRSEIAMGVGFTMVLGVAVVTLSILVVLPVTTRLEDLAREDLALALAVVLLGLLVMISRRDAVGQVIGFMSLENGLILAAVGVEGMPLVIEMLVAFAVMVAFIIFGIFVFHIRERFDTTDLSALESHRGDAP